MTIILTSPTGGVSEGGGGSGDMLKSTYDTDNDGIVEQADVITGQGALATKDTVDTTDIENGAVTNSKISNGAIGKSNLSGSVQSSLSLADSATQPGDLSAVATTGDYNDLANKPDLSVYDNVDEYADLASFPITGETGKVYVAQDTNYVYRWSGSAYTQLTDQTAIWGQVSGALGDQTDLQSAFNGKADTSHTHTKSDITDFNEADYATAAQGNKADSAVQSVVAGSNITVDNTDPQNPVVSSTVSIPTDTLQSVTDQGSTTTNSITVDGTLKISKGNSGENNSVAIGSQSLNGSVSGVSNLAIGTKALRSLQSGSYNVALGALTLEKLTTGLSNVALGYLAGRNHNGNDNIFFGNTSGGTGPNGTGLGNIGVGSRTLRPLTSGNFNVGVGYSALSLVTTGGSNICIGSRAGDVITTGSGNIIIGLNQDPSSGTASNELNIGGVIKGDLSTGDIELSADLTVDTDTLHVDSTNSRVGIGTSSPAEKLEVLGNIAVSGTVDGVDIAEAIPSTLGTAGQVLTVNAGATAGEWATPSGGGGVSGAVIARSSSTQSISNLAVTKVNYTTEDLDQDGNFASSTYTCPGDGVYRVFTMLSWSGMAANKTMNIYIYVNGVVSNYSKRDVSPNLTTNWATSHEAVLNLSSGDTVDIRVQTNTGGTTNLRSSETYLNIYKLS